MKIPMFLSNGMHVAPMLPEVVAKMTADLAYWQRFHPKLSKCSDMSTLALYLVLEVNGQCRRFMLNRIYARLSRVRQDEEMLHMKAMAPKAVFKGKDGRLWMSAGKGRA